MGIASYVVLVVVLRVSGKRTLAKLNAFDLVVTVALGSTLATALLSADVSLAEAGTAMVVLVAAQFVATWSSVRSHLVRTAVRSSPALLVRDGRVLDHQLVSNRVSLGELRQAVRSTGTGGLEAVAAVVLETDGTLSVVPSSKLGSGTALADVSGD
jgi:uncharacterized membrane protein YcaP (DUF421 family)